ncbi:unnamed protein product [Auanema sp. JU1783]|nr:unnamed protein product [Auanema sp. JU1783]
MREFIFLLFTCCYASALLCTSCPFTINPPYSTTCNETCEGDLCYIIVNKHFNGTVIAGCLNFKGNETSSNNTAVCNRGPERTMCACTTSDKCNDPTAPIAEFDFVQETILDGYQVMPQIQPTETTQKPSDEDGIGFTVRSNITIADISHSTPVPVISHNENEALTNASSSESAQISTESPSSSSSSVNSLAFTFILMVMLTKVFG